jgi:hypothetical protein
MKNLALVMTSFLALSACATTDVGVDAGVLTCDPLGAPCLGPLKGCYPVSDGTTALCVTPGAVATGAACTTVLGLIPECVAGNICLNVGNSTATTRQCVQFCNTDGGSPSCASGTCQHTSGVTFGTCL